MSDLVLTEAEWLAYQAGRQYFRSNLTFVDAQGNRKPKLGVLDVNRVEVPTQFSTFVRQYRLGLLDERDGRSDIPKPQSTGSLSTEDQLRGGAAPAPPPPPPAPPAAPPPKGTSGPVPKPAPPTPSGSPTLDQMRQPSRNLQQRTPAEQAAYEAGHAAAPLYGDTEVTKIPIPPEHAAAAWWWQLGISERRAGRGTFLPPSTSWGTVAAVAGGVGLLALVAALATRRRSNTRRTR